jgi:hypothetical protein
VDLTAKAVGFRHFQQTTHLGGEVLEKITAATQDSVQPRGHTVVLHQEFVQCGLRGHVEAEAELP